MLNLPVLQVVLKPRTVARNFLTGAFTYEQLWHGILKIDKNSTDL